MTVVMLRYNELKAELACARGRHRQTVRSRQVLAHGIVDAAQKAQLLDSLREAESEPPVKWQAASKFASAPPAKKSSNGLRCSSGAVCLQEPSPLCPL